MKNQCKHEEVDVARTLPDGYEDTIRAVCSDCGVTVVVKIFLAVVQ